MVDAKCELSRKFPIKRANSPVFNGSFTGVLPNISETELAYENCLYPISTAFARTFSLVASARIPVLLIAFDTVFLETPNASAIS